MLSICLGVVNSQVSNSIVRRDIASFEAAMGHLREIAAPESSRHHSYYFLIYGTELIGHGDR